MNRQDRFELIFILISSLQAPHIFFKFHTAIKTMTEKYMCSRKAGKAERNKMLRKCKWAGDNAVVGVKTVVFLQLGFYTDI